MISNCFGLDFDDQSDRHASLVKPNNKIEIKVEKINAVIFLMQEFSRVLLSKLVLQWSGITFMCTLGLHI
ncbi:hypothetical protein MtrunA17_Chr1g0151031 [Medicago truncatula]|uniref:Uncharacterized protein n=1 Tax=Medicago truncatula TaxID=3880 RepID=A0A396JFV0_MEDTR|nr:hypothetical protein MtrunA17_Chr1g0151031 [Medicago truncatula]